MRKIIEVENLTFTYPGSGAGIKNISFHLEEGEVLGIIGPNGSGKTTLLFSLCGLLEAQGKVSIDGEILNNKTQGRIREKIGFVFQDPDDQLFMPYVFQDVTFSLLQKGVSEKEAIEKAKVILQSLGLDDGIMGRETHKLSYGEKKKVCIAGALIHDPKILIFDEPTAWLDPPGRKEFIEIIKNLRKTTLISGHDIDMIKKVSNRVLVLEKGRVIASGGTEILYHEILKKIGFE